MPVLTQAEEDALPWPRMRQHDYYAESIARPRRGRGSNRPPQQRRIPYRPCRPPPPPPRGTRSRPATTIIQPIPVQVIPQVIPQVQQQSLNTTPNNSPNNSYGNDQIEVIDLSSDFDSSWERRDNLNRSQGSGSSGEFWNPGNNQSQLNYAFNPGVSNRNQRQSREDFNRRNNFRPRPNSRFRGDIRANVELPRETLSQRDVDRFNANEARNRGQRQGFRGGYYQGDYRNNREFRGNINRMSLGERVMTPEQERFFELRRKKDIERFNLN